MEITEFIKLKERFINSDTEEKIEIYSTTKGLTMFQYKELLKSLSRDEFMKLEKALA